MFHVVLMFFMFASSIAESESEESESAKISNLDLAKILPSEKTLEEVGVQILDALIKRGQMEMAKGAFKTQLEVLRKVQPEQYEKFKTMSVEQLAADAVLEQAEIAKMMPKTGNRFVDMLHENGIPIGSSIKGIQQAIMTQREMEENDPAEQIIKAVLEKFQKQILPGIVANAIAGRNPFRVPSQDQVRQMAGEGKHQDTKTAETMEKKSNEPFYYQNPGIKRKPVSKASDRSYERSTISEMNKFNNREIGDADELEILKDEVTTEQESHSANKPKIPFQLLSRIENSPRLSAIYRQINTANSGSSKEENWSAHTPSLFHPKSVTMSELPLKEALVMGAYEAEETDENNDEDEKVPRMSPLQTADFESSLKESEHLSMLLDSSQLAYQLSHPEKYLKPKKIFNNPNPQPGYFKPRKLPKRPRSMLPLLTGLHSEEIVTPFNRAKKPSDPFLVRKRAPVKHAESTDHSRVLEHLENNPALATLFENTDLAERLSRNNVLTESQKGHASNRRHIVTSYPNKAAGAKTYFSDFPKADSEIKQDIEERPIPPLLFNPKGKHTRIRFVGATEREIPGLGGRLIIPSLDPTMPAINTVMQTQGRERDEYDTIIKLPNNINDGGNLGLHSKIRSERFYGGDGMGDAPALGPTKLNL